MPRPVKCRRIERLPDFRSFSPNDINASETVLMSLDEYETLRIMDVEGATQEECAVKMNIARTTVTAIYDSARKKVADAIVHGKRLLIAGGCWTVEPVQTSQEIMYKGANAMRVAITFDNGEVFQHFGHTEQFKLYDIEDGKVVGEQILDSDGNGHCALAGLLQTAKVDALICGGIGMGAIMALSDSGIRVYPGVQGNADEVAKAFAEGRLEYNPDARCDHHDHHHEDGGHCHGGEGHCHSGGCNK